MLTTDLIERVLGTIPDRRIGVLGDLFLDRYLDLDPALNEPSLETGLTAYQVVGVRSYAGAAGTVVNNLAALGVGRVVPLAYLGDDGEGYELRQALARLPGIDPAHVLLAPDRRTPTYTKPLLHEYGSARELNRLDIKNRTPTPAALEDQILERLDAVWPTLDALVVLDQVSEADCGVITTRVRQRVQELARRDPDKFVLADSRERIGEFCYVWLKPNAAECVRAVFGSGVEPHVKQMAAVALARRSGRPVFCTDGPVGIHLARPDALLPLPVIPAYPVDGPIDPVGAGDSCSAGLAAAKACGLSDEQAAAFGNLVASITIQQIGVTGTATPGQVRARWREVAPA